MKNTIDLASLSEHELCALIEEAKTALEAYRNNKKIKVYQLTIPFRDNVRFINIENLLNKITEDLELTNGRCWLINETQPDLKTEIKTVYINQNDLIFCDDYAQ